MIENQITIYKENNQFPISARELHNFLENKRKFTDWFNQRINQYDFIQDKDFTFHKIVKSTTTGATTTNEYFISFNMAKQLSMVENNQKGQEARNYFIKAEEKLIQIKEQFIPKNEDELILQSIKILQNRIEQQKKQLEYQQPKVELCDIFLETNNCLTVSEFANSFNIPNLGRNNMFKLLIRMGFLQKNKVPYRRYIEAGYFEIRNIPLKNGKSVSQTMITKKGIEYLVPRIKDFLSKDKGL